MGCRTPFCANSSSRRPDGSADLRALAGVPDVRIVVRRLFHPGQDQQAFGRNRDRDLHKYRKDGLFPVQAPFGARLDARSPTPDDLQVLPSEGTSLGNSIFSRTISEPLWKGRGFRFSRCRRAGVVQALRIKTTP